MRKFLTALSLRNALFIFLVIVTADGLYQLANRYHLQRDVTHNALNSLEPASLDVLRQLKGPVNISVYATEQDARLGDIRKIIRDFVSLYQRYKSDINLTFIDPEKEPEKTRAAGIQLNGEMVIEYAGRSEHLTQINESILTGTLLRLAHTRDQLVMYLDGHGERKLDGIANHDLGALFGAKLRQNGFRIASLKWRTASWRKTMCSSAQFSSQYRLPHVSRPQRTSWQGFPRTSAAPYPSSFSAARFQITTRPSSSVPTAASAVPATISSGSGAMRGTESTIVRLRPRAASNGAPRAYSPRTSVSKRGLPRSGSKLGSMRSQAGVR